jgi:aldehyde dehydrogenase (NAD+)
VLATIIRETFADNEVALFEGDASVATALLTLPFDHIFFTGAPSIGKLVMAAAARHLSSVTLELGGKCPTIVDRSADLDMAVKTIAWAKFSNCGQTCIAPDHVYVHREVAQPFITKFKTLLSNLYGEGDAVKSAPLGRIINSRHTRRVAALLNDARHRGAAILHGGLIDENDHFISPTLIGNVPLDAAIMNDEIFGPVLPIIEFSEVDDVIAKINAQPKPLALYIWSRDLGACERVIQNTSAGGTCINHQSIQFLHHNLPFCGVNNSGIGSYHGEWGIKAFSHERAIVRSNIMLAGIFLPPYTPWTRRVVDFILRAF